MNNKEAKNNQLRSVLFFLGKGKVNTAPRAHACGIVQYSLRKFWPSFTHLTPVAFWCGVKMGVQIVLLLFIATGCALVPQRQVTFEGVPEETTQYVQSNLDKRKITIGNIPLTVEIADDPHEQTKGLSDREILGENQGMLFIYSGPQNPSFWMKDMRFPIDIIWIRDGVIVDISENVPLFEDGYITRRSPSHAADAVLEVNAGWAQLHGIRIGDFVK